MPEEEIQQVPKDPFVGVFDITFNTNRNVISLGVRIAHWKIAGNGALFYLIGDDGSIYNFHSIAKMIRIGD